MGCDSFQKVLASVEAAALHDVVNLTNDRIEALAGGHGMVNMAMFSVANVITEELLRGQSLEVKFANARRLPVDDIMEKAVKAAKDSGADAANAALIAACMMYLAGSAAQVGIPAGNRKLGATARMIAGVDRCGVSAVPTSKMNSKISAFPAVQAIYNAAVNGELCSINGADIPKNVAGAIYGHSALGEDFIWPEVAKKGAQIGTRAMLDAMHGVGIGGNAFQAAVLGAAAILEIIHPDAEVPEECGTYGRTSSVYLVGKAAAETAGLPEKLHMRITGQEYETAHIVGDVGLILKDIGGPSVVGMMTFVEIFSCFKERICGASGAPHNSPLGHMTCYTVCAMKALAEGMTPEETGKAIVKDRSEDTVYPESGIFSIYVVARKAAELRNGPVTRVLTESTLPYVVNMICDKAKKTCEGLQEGKSLGEIVRELDDERVHSVETHLGKWWKKVSGDDVEMKVLKIANSARRKESKLVRKYLAFDPLIDIEIRRNDKHAVLEHFVDQVIPQVCTGEKTELAWAVTTAAPAVSDIVLSGGNILNVVVPTAVAAVLGYGEVTEIAGEAERAAYVTAGIPGGKAAAVKVAKLAAAVSDTLT